MGVKYRKHQVFLESSCCQERFLFSKIRRGKWKPYKEIVCPNCDSVTTLNEWDWVYFTERGWKSIPFKAGNKLVDEMGIDIKEYPMRGFIIERKQRSQN